MAPKRNISPFAVIVTFIALSLAGLALLPLLSVSLMPSRSLPGMTVSFQMPGQSAKIVESEVTGKLEGLLVSVNGVKGVKSTSRDGSGDITIDFDRHCNMQTTRFEVASIIRQAWDNFPQGISYPSITMRSPENGTSGPMLSYTLNAHAGALELTTYCEEKIKPVIGAVKGVSGVAISGAHPMEWHITVDANTIRHLGISMEDIRKSIASNFESANVVNVGNVEMPTEASSPNRLDIVLTTREFTDFNLNLPVGRFGGKLVLLRDIVKVEHKEGEGRGYYRINGQNSIYITIFSDASANEVALAKEVTSAVDKIAMSLPRGYSLSLIHDSSKDITSELDKIYFRSAMTLVLLLLFVAVVSMSLRYTILIIVSIILSLAISCGLYFLLGIEIHLYSLAGITISLNLIIDNLIVMADSLVRGKNLKSFTAILAASLTTVGALTAVFLLDEASRLTLQDFVNVIIINLSVSLLTALFLVPSLTRMLKLDRKRRMPGRLKSSVLKKLENLYGAAISFLCRYRWIVAVAVIFAIGFPVFLLPDKIEGDSRWAKCYNEIVTSQSYREKIKPVIEAVFGGTMRLFAEKVPEGGYFTRDYSSLRLRIHATLPNGATLQQMNSLIGKMERFLEGFPQIKRFETNVSDSRHAYIVVEFHKKYISSGFPYQLKGDVVRKALTLGGGSWSVFGLEDMGFNNDFMERAGSSAIKLTGYNYDDLRRIAAQLSDSLLSNRRIKEVDLLPQVSFWKDDYTEIYLDINHHAITEAGIEPTTLFREISPLFGQVLLCGYADGKYGKEPIYLMSSQSGRYDIWALENMPVEIGGHTYKVKDFITMSQRQAPQAVAKENQQYVLYAQYEYIGSYKQSEMVQKRIVENMNKSLPLGYTLNAHKSYYFNDGSDGWNKYWLLLYVAVVIFFISSILFNSFRQPLAIIAVIPPSFIGIFLAFYLFDIKFDQGGFASFILLSGITVNAAIYIVNEFNCIRRINPHINVAKCYILAFRRKITPILLTVTSTILGFIPFLIGEQREGFWFPLAIGTIGGLCMSILVITILLPMLLIPRSKSVKNR